MNVLKNKHYKNQQETRKRGRPKETWKRTILEAAKQMWQTMQRSYEVLLYTGLDDGRAGRPRKMLPPTGIFSCSLALCTPSVLVSVSWLSCVLPFVFTYNTQHIHASGGIHARNPSSATGAWCWSWIRSPDRPARSEWLHRLLDPGLTSIYPKHSSSTRLPLYVQQEHFCILTLYPDTLFNQKKNVTANQMSKLLLCVSCLQ